MRKWLALLALLAVGITFYSILRATSRPAAIVAHATSPVSRPQPLPPRSFATPSPAPTAAAEVGSRTASAPPVHTPHPQPAPPAKIAPLPEELANVAPETALENMRSTIRQYGSMFAGNPVGTNEEITQALHGENPKHINFLTSDGNRLDSQGELVDTWGTPYFFHQLSGHEMEIRSAGPDRKMYTGDDLVIH